MLLKGMYILCPTASMSSSQLKLCYMWGTCGLKRKWALGKGWGLYLVGTRAVDFQHGTRMERGLRHAVMTTTLSKELLTCSCIHGVPHDKLLTLYHCIILYIFLSSAG
jgi:hypothetical protein